jgi:hypothetical protein
MVQPYFKKGPGHGHHRGHLTAGALLAGGRLTASAIYAWAAEISVRFCHEHDELPDYFPL